MDNWIPAFISGFFLLAAAVVAWFGSRKKHDSESRSKDAEAHNLSVITIDNLLKQVDGLIKARMEDRERMDEMQVVINTLEKTVNDLQEKSDALEERVNEYDIWWPEIRKWFAEFMLWVEEKGYTGYPPIPKSVKDRDTKDKMRSVK